MRNTLVIGYGNDLRGDDGAGIRAAELIAERYSGVDCIGVQQLTPELAATISNYQTVIFIDASLLVVRCSVSMLYPCQEGRVPSSHNSSPQGLLDLCAHLYNQIPLRTMLLQIPVHDLGLNRGCTKETRQHIEQCVEFVGELLKTGAAEPLSMRETTR